MQSGQKNTKSSSDSQKKSTESEATNNTLSTEPAIEEEAPEEKIHEDAGDYRDSPENLGLKAALRSLTQKFENSKAREATTVKGLGNPPYGNLLNGGDGSAIGKIQMDQELQEKDEMKLPNPFCDRFVLTDSAAPVTKTAIKRDQNTLLELPAEVVGLIQESFQKNMELKVPDQAAFYVQPGKDGYYFGSDEKKSLETTAVDTSEETLESLEYESSDGHSSSPDYETACAMTPEASERDALPDFLSKPNCEVEQLMNKTIDSLPFDDDPMEQVNSHSKSPGTPTASQNMVPTEDIRPSSGKLSYDASSRVFPEELIEARPITGTKEITTDGSLKLVKKKPSTAGSPSDDSSLGSYPFEMGVCTPHCKSKPDSPPEGDVRDQFCDHLDKCPKKHYSPDRIKKKPPAHLRQPKMPTFKGVIPTDVFPVSRRGKSLFSALSPKGKDDISQTESGEEKRHTCGSKFAHLEKRVLIRTKVQARSVAPMSTIVDSPRYHSAGSDKPHWRF